MNRRQLEHVIRASGDVCGDTEIIVVGSQAVLGSFPDAPEDLLVSMEAEIIPKNSPERAIEVDGAMGELSPFHTTFGYYAHGVSEETATLPAGWRERLVPVVNENTKGVTGWCLSPADIAVSKLAAGRDKDVRFVASLLKHGLVSRAQILNALSEAPAKSRQLVEQNLKYCGPTANATD